MLGDHVHRVRPRAARPSTSPRRRTSTTVVRHGIIRQPEDKNAALLPHRIEGKWVLLLVPRTEFGLARRDPPSPRSADLEELERAGAGHASARRRLVG